jgi:hypothetical protein
LGTPQISKSFTNLPFIFIFCKWDVVHRKSVAATCPHKRSKENTKQISCTFITTRYLVSSFLLFYFFWNALRVVAHCEDTRTRTYSPSSICAIIYHLVKLCNFIDTKRCVYNARNLHSVAYVYPFAIVCFSQGQY